MLIAKQIIAGAFVVLLLFVPATRAEEKNTDVRFGALVLLTGDMAFLGELCRDGMKLASDDVNAAGGIAGRPLRILYEDFGPFDLKKAASAGHKLISSDKVDALLPQVFEDTEIVAPLAARGRVPLMATGPGGINIGKNGANVFRATNTDRALLEAQFDYLKGRTLRKVLLLGAENSYFESLTNAAVAEADKRGLSLEILRVAQDEMDFKPLSSRLKRSNYEAIVSLLMPAQFGVFLRAARSNGVQLPILGAPY